MKVNNIDVSKYHGEVSSKLIQPCTIDLSHDRVKDSFFVLNEEDKFKSVEIKISFRDKDRATVYDDISNFMLLFRDVVDIKFKNLDHYYKLFITDSSTEDTEFDDWSYLNLKLEGYEYSDLQQKNFNLVTTATINNVGNIDTPCIVEITATTVNLLDFKITGLTDDIITINTLRKNEKVVIDGINGTVTAGGNNKFGDSDMWEFPKLKPGGNNISFSRDTCNVTIKFYPRYF